jgi:hypothetical protein
MMTLRMPNQLDVFGINTGKTQEIIVKATAGSKKTNPIAIKNKDYFAHKNSIH